MTSAARRRPAGSDVITPADLIEAPQLAALAVLENAIYFTRLALLAAHVELLADDQGPGAGSWPDAATNAAERFLVRAYEMHTVVREYRAAVAQVLADGGRGRDDDA